MVSGLQNPPTPETDTSIRQACRSARRGGFAIRNTSAMSPHDHASSAVDPPVRLTTFDLPNQVRWGGRSVMNGQCPSARLITGRYTASETRNGGGPRRGLIRLRMLCASGGTRGTAVSNTRAKWQKREAVLCLPDVMDLLSLGNKSVHRRRRQGA